jgi:uncharacterized protein YuzB (UPF0349 family)
MGIMMVHFYQERKSANEFTDACKAIEILRQNHKDEVDVVITDCFRRCLRCKELPFCRIQLTTIEENDAETLVEQIVQTVRS